MRDHVSICLRALTGSTGKFSDELEAFWREVERQYRCCNVFMIPQDHIPLWHARAVDQRIPIEAKPVSTIAADEANDSTVHKIHWKTQQAQERKAAMAGA